MGREMNSNQVVIEDTDYICRHLLDELFHLEGKTILITGGAGFLGYYLVKALLHWNFKYMQSKPICIIIYDNFMRGAPPWLEEVRNNANIIIKESDISQEKLNPQSIFHYIIHAASIASPAYYRLHPIKTMDTNVNGIRHILDYACDRERSTEPVDSILYFSSSEIYGDPLPEYIPTPETYFGHVSCTGPRACYDESKRYGETLCINFYQQYGVQVKIARPFNNYGPGLKVSDKRLIPDIVKNILNQDDVVLFSDGGPKRTFCYVADAIIGYLKVLINGQAGEAYNIGTDMPEVSVKELASLIINEAKHLFGYQGKIRFEKSDDVQYLTDNPQRRCPKIDKASSHLNYFPKITLDSGIRKTLIWYKDNQYVSEC